jgi:hypothetical protein
VSLRIGADTHSSRSIDALMSDREDDSNNVQAPWPAESGPQRDQDSLPDLRANGAMVDSDRGRWNAFFRW